MNAFRAGLKLVPSVGAGLEQLMFGGREEIRFKRLQSTLNEVVDLLKKQGQPEDGMASEEYCNLLEQVTPALARTTSEEKRKRFRDLLFNSAQLKPGDGDWDAAQYAAALLEKIEGPGLAIIAAVATGNEMRHDTMARVHMAEDPCPHVFCADRISESPLKLSFGVTRWGTELPYEWALLEHWMEQLTELGIFYEKRRRSGAGFEDISFTNRGRFFVKWTVRQ